MRIDLKEILHVPGAERSFFYTLSVPDLELNWQHPVTDSLYITGSVRNVAGVLLLSAELRTTLHWSCDRCASPFCEEKVLPVHAVLAESVENEDNEEIVLLDHGELDLDDLLISALVLETPMKILCREDCKGLCPYCGQNLNDGDCGCPGNE